MLCLALSAHADTVTLKSGEKVEGRILTETDTELTIEVKVSGSIKDQRAIKKADVEKIDKVQPDLEAWEPLKNISTGEESLEGQDYQRAINVLNSFVSQFPQSPRAAEAKQKISALQEEMKRVDAGEMKVAGKWLTADEVKEERVQITGRALLARMKRHAAAGQLVEAMNAFEALDKSASASASFPDAVVLARQIAPRLKAAADQARVQLKAQAEERKRRLANVQGAERAQLEALQRQQQAQTDAAVAALEKSGVKWLPLSPATDRSLSTISTLAGGLSQTLNQHNVQRMKDSLAATDRVKDALANNDADAAVKGLAEANAAWSKNEYITRLQPKVAAAKTKAQEAALAAAKTAAAEPAAKPKPTPSAAPVAVVVEEEPKKESGSVLSKPFFWVILLLVLGAAAFVMKALGKFRDPNKNILDQ
jgi:hypothetical protein